MATSSKWKLWLLLVPVLAAIPVWAVAQSGLTVFSNGQAISSAAINNNFSFLSNRITALEGAAAVPTAAVRVSTTCTITQSMSDCPCSAGEVPIGGGAAALPNFSINASQPSSTFTTASPGFWRVACTDGTARVTCTLPFAICLKVK